MSTVRLFATAVALTAAAIGVGFIATDALPLALPFIFLAKAAAALALPQETS